MSPSSSGTELLVLSFGAGGGMHGSLFDGMYRPVVIRPIPSPADGTDRTVRPRALTGSASMVHR